MLTLTGMGQPKNSRPPGHFPRPTPKIYLGDYLALRNIKAKELAAALDVTEAAVSRWIDNIRHPRPESQDKIERFLGLRPGGLHLPPSAAPDETLMAGLDESGRAQVLDYIRFLHTRKN